MRSILAESLPGAVRSRSAGLLCGLTLSLPAFAQIEPVLVTEQTLKVEEPVELLYGFAAGDEIIFDLEVVRGGNIREVEILTYPDTPKFVDFKTGKISGKRLQVTQASIFIFRLKNNGAGKVCNLKISRVPATRELAGFDTGIDWKVRYDTVYLSTAVPEISRIDTNIITLTDRVERVHSKTRLYAENQSMIELTLPANRKTELHSAEVLSWAYWIGAGKEAQAAFELEAKNFLLKTIPAIGKYISPLAGLAVGAYSIAVHPPAGDNIHYALSITQQGKTQLLSEGNSVVAHGRIVDHRQGQITVTLRNDNIIDGINVDVKVVVAMIEKTYRPATPQDIRVDAVRYPDIRGKN